VNRLESLDRRSDPRPIAPVDRGRERGGDRQPQLRPLANEAIEVRSRNTPGLHVCNRANARCPLIQQEAEVAERSRCGNRRDQSVALVDSNADLDHAASEQVQRIRHLALAHYDRTGSEMSILARTDQSSDIDAVEATQVFDASKELLLGRYLLGVLIG